MNQSMINQVFQNGSSAVKNAVRISPLGNIRINTLMSLVCMIMNKEIKFGLLEQLSELKIL